MSKNLITIDIEAPVHDAIKLMAEKDIGALVVTEKDEPVGIVTERDVLKKCGAEFSCKAAKTMELMSKPLITVDADTRIGVATELMLDKKIRRLLVTEGGKIIGIVTQKDLLIGTLEAFHALDWTFLRL